VKKTKRVSVHHRTPRSHGGDNSPKNLVTVNDSRHKGWHQCFENKTPEQIVWELNNLWLPVDCKVSLKRRQ